MSSRTSTVIFLFTLVAILFQGLVWHAWNTGTLNYFSDVYRNFGNTTPRALSFGVRTLPYWWGIPFISALLLSVVCFAANRSRWLLLPLALSLSSASVMIYIMYSGPLVRMGVN